MLKVAGYDVWFNHDKNENGVLNTGSIFSNRTPYHGTTLCIIEKNGVKVSEARSYCSVHDNFNKAIGRKVALERALFGFSIEDRTLLWKKYIETTSRL